MAVTLPYNFNNDTLTKARLQEVLDLLAASNSQIGGEDILAGAAIPQSKLGSITGNIQVEIPITIQAWAAGWPNGAVAAAIVGTATAIEPSTWTVKGYKYVVLDTTVTAASTFGLYYGYYDGAGAWNDTTTIATGKTMVDIDAGAGGLAVGSGALNVALGATVGSPSCVVIKSESAATNLLQAGIMNVTLLLQRSITL